jgi:hypothetical protein
LWFFSVVREECPTALVSGLVRFGDGEGQCAVDAREIVDAFQLRLRDRDEIPVVVLVPVAAVLGRGSAAAARRSGRVTAPGGGIFSTVIS